MFNLVTKVRDPQNIQDKMVNLVTKVRDPQNILVK
ncbi:unnamed protein product, partial [Allacma fusca]